MGAEGAVRGDAPSGALVLAKRNLLASVGPA